MMATLVGREGFRSGMDLYFQRHDGQAVTCDDFVQAIADANADSALHRQLDGFKRWYAQAGTPTLRARGEFNADARRYTLTLSQSAQPSPGQGDKLPSLIPVQMGLVASADGRALTLRLEGEAQAGGTERVLVLGEAEQRFVFVNVEAEPVPSLLRGLSAPVHLDDGLDDAALVTLLQHDADAFNRWEAGQRLALSRLLAALDGGSDLQALDDAFVQAMRRVLRDESLDAAFKHLLLTLPGEAYIAERCAVVNPQRIHTLREQMRLQLAARLRDDWVWAFESHQVREGYRPTPTQAGRRALANLALQLLVLDAVDRGDAQWPGRALQRFEDAAQMTDRVGALVALLDGHSPLADAALARFHALFAGDDLVIDKWFNLQASASEALGAGAGSVLPRVKALLQHPDFSLKNPNRARSLLIGYCRENPAAFHRADAAGYVFWADRVLEIDAFNPQLASRLARTMDRWGALAEPWRSAAREAVARVAASARLSADVREIVTKSLES
jgi:aminopeptidase N